FGSNAFKANDWPLQWNLLVLFKPNLTTCSNTNISLINIPANATWIQNGMTVAGSNGKGIGTNQVNEPYGLFLDDQQTVVIADQMNHRITQWKNDNKNNEQVIAGDNGDRSALNQLNQPTDVLIDKETDSLIICDHGNRRVVQWSCRSGAKEGIVVAGDQGTGTALTQLSYPYGLFNDTLYTLYVADSWNHRVIRWIQGVKQGTVIVGGNGAGAGANQFSVPVALSFDRHGNLYVVDHDNNRIQRFSIE
ncbi:unnamed protein product, partial [Rotaria socialis]